MPFRGIPYWALPEEIKIKTQEKIAESRQGEKNPLWQGNNVGRVALHEWMGNRIPKPALCEQCHAQPPFDLTNISGKYKRDLDDWEWLCRRCHMVKDGRINNLKQGKRKGGVKI